MKNILKKIKTLFAVAKTTDTELCGQPIIMLLIITGIVLTALIPLLHFQEFGEPGRICRDGALAYQLIIGTIITVAATSASIHDEIANGTVLAAIGKPIARHTFIIAKWMGVMITTFRFWTVSLCASLIAWRIPNRVVLIDSETYKAVPDSQMQLLLFLIPIFALLISGFLHNRRKVRFTKCSINTTMLLSLAVVVYGIFFDRLSKFNITKDNLDYNVIPVSFLILLCLAIYGAIAACLSTRLKAPIVLIISFVLLALGLSSDSISSVSPFFAYIPLPNLQSFWMVDAVANGKTLPLTYLVPAIIYSVSSISISLIAASLLFKNKDIS